MKWIGVLLALSLAANKCPAQAVIDSNFSKGSLGKQGWKATGAWDVYQYPAATANPGPVIRFAAHKPVGTLARSFAEVKSPRELTLSLDYGWGWGDAAQAADSVSFMLLDSHDDGYLFEVHRCKARWAVQWGKVVHGRPDSNKVWAAAQIDATHPAIRDGGGLSGLTIRRRGDGAWSMTGKDWNRGAGATVRFIDTTTTAFSRLVLLGTPNFDEQAYNHVLLKVVPSARSAPTTAIPVTAFLNSIGVVTTFPDRGQPVSKTVQMLRYGGFRWVRGGIEGLTERGPTTIQTYLALHQQAGVHFSWGLGSGGTDLGKLIRTARQIAKADALLAFEGNNEPNNWGVRYHGERGGGRAPSWLAVAKLQSDLYRAVKKDPVLARYPVWSISEGGAERDNVGLQYLTIPEGARTLMPSGTRYADFANVHNYVYHPGASGLEDNKTWNAAEPTSLCKVDGLCGNYGVTWAKHFPGYSETRLQSLPRVTTETGCTIGGTITEDVQALNLLSLYLDQFKRGWSHTAVYLLRDRTDEAGNQSFGLFKSDYTPRRAAVYLHNLTTILADRASKFKAGQMAYSIPEQPATVHEMLLQTSDGTFELVVWDERLQGNDEVTVHLGQVHSVVTVYDPTAGTKPVALHHNVDAVKLILNNHPLVIAIPSEAWKPAQAGKYMDERQQAWFAYARCISCHSGLPYALARPALRKLVGATAPTKEEERLLTQIKLRVGNWNKLDSKEFGLYYDSSEELKKQSWGTEAVFNAVILAFDDRYQRRSSPGEATKRAFANLWQTQVQAGVHRGSWEWLDFAEAPWGNQDARYFGAALAAIALATAPGYYTPGADPEIDARVALLRGYLKAALPRQNLHNKVWGLWAAATLKGILTEAEQKQLVDQLLDRQNADGGWSLPSLGTWVRHDHTAQATGSDGYATALILHVLRTAGLPKDDVRVTKGLTWLGKHQAATGAWPSVSLVKKRNLATHSGKFMSDAATAFAVLALSD